MGVVGGHCIFIIFMPIITIRILAITKCNSGAGEVSNPTDRKRRSWTTTKTRTLKTRKESMGEIGLSCLAGRWPRAASKSPSRVTSFIRH